MNSLDFGSGYNPEKDYKDYYECRKKNKNYCRLDQ